MHVSVWGEICAISGAEFELYVTFQSLGKDNFIVEIHELYLYSFLY